MRHAHHAGPSDDDGASGIQRRCVEIAARHRHARAAASRPSRRRCSSGCADAATSSASSIPRAITSIAARGGAGHAKNPLTLEEVAQAAGRRQQQRVQPAGCGPAGAAALLRRAGAAGRAAAEAHGPAAHAGGRRGAPHAGPRAAAAIEALGARLERMVLVTVHPELLCRPVLRRINGLIVVGSEAERRCSVRRGHRARPGCCPRRRLEPGQVLVWLRAAAPALQRLGLQPGARGARRHSRKYAEGELAGERSFYFVGPEGKLNLRAQNLLVFLQMRRCRRRHLAAPPAAPRLLGAGSSSRSRTPSWRPRCTPSKTRWRRRAGSRARRCAPPSSACTRCRPDDRPARRVGIWRVQRWTSPWNTSSPARAAGIFLQLAARDRTCWALQARLRRKSGLTGPATQELQQKQILAKCAGCG